MPALSAHQIGGASGKSLITHSPTSQENRKTALTTQSPTDEISHYGYCAYGLVRFSQLG